MNVPDSIEKVSFYNQKVMSELKYRQIGFIMSASILSVIALGFFFAGNFFGGFIVLSIVLLLIFFGFSKFLSNKVSLEYLKIREAAEYKILDFECSKALKILSPLPLYKASSEALILHFLSVSKSYQGELEASAEAMRRSLARSKKSGAQFPIVILRKFSLAGLLIKLNHFDEAEELIADCFSILDNERMNDLHLRSALNGQLSDIEFRKEHFDKSHDYIRKALEYKLKCKEDPPWLQPHSWYHIKFKIVMQAARVVCQREQKHLIPDLAEESLSLIEKLPRHFKPSIALELSELASMLADIGEKDMSDYFLKLLEEARLMAPEHSQVVQALADVQFLADAELKDFESEKLEIPVDNSKSTDKDLDGSVLELKKKDSIENEPG